VILPFNAVDKDLLSEKIKRIAGCSVSPKREIFDKLKLD
jgi:hypothetical protein